MPYFRLRPLTWKFRLLMLLPLLVMASLPLLVYFEPEYEHSLLLMLLTLIVGQSIISMHTAALAARAMHRLRKMSGNWELLALTNIEGQSLSRYVWLDTLRHTWIDHALLALPRLGMALAFAQHLHISDRSRPPFVFNTNAFLYISHSDLMSTSHDLDGIFANPHTSQIIIAFCVLLVYAIAEGALMAALGILWGVFTNRYEVTFAGVAVSRISIALAGIIGVWPTVIFAETLISSYYSTGIRLQLHYCSIAERNSTDDINYPWGKQLQETGVCYEASHELALIRATEGMQVTLLSFYEQGTLVGAGIMRIHVPLLPEVRTTISETQYYLVRLRPIMRHLLSAILAMLIYVVLIGSALRLARVRLVRQGFI